MLNRLNARRSHDSSDDEWKSSIRIDYGEGGAEMLREAATQVDAGLDTVGLVNHSFYHYEVMSDVAATNFQGGPTWRVAAATVYENVPFFDAGLHDGFDHDEPCPEDEDCTQVCDDEDEGPLPNTARLTLHHGTQTLLFAGSRLSSLTATLLLLNLCRTHQCSNLFITELLTI
jgi:hypothetical protein